MNDRDSSAGRVSASKLGHGVLRRHNGIAEVIAATVPHQSRPARDEPTVKQPWELVQVEVGQRQSMAELAPGVEAPVANRALVDAARAHSCAPKRSPTRSALTTPSSWNPHPQ